MDAWAEQNRKPELVETETPEDYWPCACHRTFRGKRQIKLNGPNVPRCTRCHALRDGGFAR